MARNAGSQRGASQRKGHRGGMASYVEENFVSSEDHGGLSEAKPLSIHVFTIIIGLVVFMVGLLVAPTHLSDDVITFGMNPILMAIGTLIFMAGIVLYLLHLLRERPEGPAKGLMRKHGF